MKSARFIIVENFPDQPLVIRDVGPWHLHPTVTNDAENVVASLAEKGHLPAGRRLFYYDSERRRDEILVRDGRFAGFAPGGGR